MSLVESCFNHSLLAVFTANETKYGFQVLIRAEHTGDFFIQDIVQIGQVILSDPCIFRGKDNVRPQSRDRYLEEILVYETRGHRRFFSQLS